uniref:CDIP transferase, opposite strand n=1 Tax=Peromyscus maniculatus bairdii TaxID=230844 RepID=A0A8C8W3B4_PERMB
MASTSARNGEKKDSWSPQAAASLGGGQKVSLSRSEEFLTRISAELTDEALFIARSHVNSVPIKEKQMKDQGTQISRHALTEIAPAPRHTSCHLLVKRECSPTA